LEHTFHGFEPQRVLVEDHRRLRIVGGHRKGRPSDRFLRGF
jgi:hypothetical protein